MKRQLAVRRAFTTVELLTVIAIIAVLMALLLPAVQMMREGSRKTVCLNNLKNIGLAFHQHNNAWQHFPNAGGYDTSPPVFDLERCQKGGTTGPVTIAPTKQQDWGWAYQVMPYIQKKDFYEQASPAQAVNGIIKLYICPSRARPNSGMVNGQGCGLAAGAPRSGIDYAGNAGYRVKVQGQYTLPQPSQDGTKWDNWEFEPDGTVIPGKRTSDPAYNKNRVAYPLSADAITLSSGALPDGASTTVLLGERRMTLPFDVQDTAEDNGFPAGYTWDTIRWAYFVPAPDGRQNQDFPLPQNQLNVKFGSPHSSVCNFVYCDGTVRQISYSINIDVFHAICSRNDGNRGVSDLP